MALSVADARAALADGDESIRHGAIERLDLQEPGALALLVRAMADPAWRVRREAVERVGGGAFSPSALVEVLVPTLGEPDDVGLRNAAIEAVVALGAHAVPALHAALAGRPAHRKVLCDVIGRIGAAASAPPLLALLGDDEENVRVAAAEALGRVGADEPLTDEAAVGRALLAELGALGARPDADRAALYGAALLDAIARRRAAIPLEGLRALLEHPVLGAGALRAVAAGAAPDDSSARAALRGLAATHLADALRPRREAALLAVASLADDEARLPLDEAARASATQALFEATVEVQRAAAAVLGLSGDAAVARPLLVALEDAALTDAATDALALLCVRDPDALAGVVTSLAEPARAAIYRALARGARPGADGALAVVASLGRDLESEDEALAVSAIEALGALGAAVDAPALADALVAGDRAGPEGYDRLLAARRALCAIARRHPVEVGALVRARVEAAFVELLGELGAGADLPLLAARLADAEADVRRAAANAIAVLAGRPLTVAVDALAKAADAARTALVDEAPGVRAAAAGAVARLEALRPEVAAAAVDALLVAARDEDLRVRGAAARALVDLGALSAPGVRAALRLLADGRDGLTAVPALEALLQQHDDDDDARLLDALTGGDEERRKVALYALATRPRLLVRGDLLRLVERALYDVRWDLRRAAVAALVAVGDVGRSALVGRRRVETDTLVRGDLDRALAEAVA